MRSSSRIVSRCFLACISFSACTGVVPAQQVTLGAPAIGLGDSFREGISTNLAFSQGSPNGLFFFRSGGLPPALGATTFGIGQSRGGRSWRLGISVMQGSDRTLSSVTPSLTLSNGVPGFINNSTQRPFVFGFTPVVGADLARTRERAAFRDRFHRAAVRAREARQRSAEAESEAVKAAANASTGRPARRDLDPPLVLGTGRTSTAPTRHANRAMAR